jgi:HAD superfamily hydrolase (TIGR01509 family)
VPRAALEDAYARLQEYYAAHAPALAVHPEMRPLLQACRAARIRCGLFTGRGSDSTRLILATLDLASAFDAVVAGDEATRPKPAPDGVLQLVAALGCDAAATLVVGDSPLDVEAARAAGAEAVFAAWHAWAGSTPPRGVAVLAHPDALRPLVGLPRVAGPETGVATV